MADDTEGKFAPIVRAAEKLIERGTPASEAWCRAFEAKCSKNSRVRRTAEGLTESGMPALDAWMMALRISNTDQTRNGA